MQESHASDWTAEALQANLWQAKIARAVCTQLDSLDAYVVIIIFSITIYQFKQMLSISQPDSEIEFWNGMLWTEQVKLYKLTSTHPHYQYLITYQEPKSQWEIT